MKAKSIIIQILISALTCSIIIHFATPKYVRDTMYDLECEREDRSVIMTLATSENLIDLSHDELHKKRMDLEQAHQQQIKAQKEAQMEQERQGQILEDVLGEVQIMSEEEIAKEAQRIREQNRK